MNEYLDLTDYSVNIQEKRLQQIIEDNPLLIENAEDTAIAVVTDALYSMYDTEVIFAKRGEKRDLNVVRWCKYLVIYAIYERIPDKLVPERVKDNYTDTLDMLDKISDGKRSVNLPHRVTEEGRKITKFRWGSSTPRSH